MSTISNTQRLATAYVHQIFRNLESGDGKRFFDHVADNVDWIVEGAHPLAGHYHSKADFLAGTFEKLAEVLPQGAQLHVKHVLLSNDWAVVELRSNATARNGLKFDNRYWWVCRFGDGKIVEVRAYRRARKPFARTARSCGFCEEVSRSNVPEPVWPRTIRQPDPRMGVFRQPGCDLP